MIDDGTSLPLSMEHGNIPALYKFLKKENGTTLPHVLDIVQQVKFQPLKDRVCNDQLFANKEQYLAVGMMSGLVRFIQFKRYG